MWKYMKIYYPTSPFAIWNFKIRGISDNRSMSLPVLFSLSKIVRIFIYVQFFCFQLLFIYLYLYLSISIYLSIYLSLYIYTYTGCGLVRAPPSVLVLAPVILKQFSKFKNPLHNENKLVSLCFIKKKKKKNCI